MPGLAVAFSEALAPTLGVRSRIRSDAKNADGRAPSSRPARVPSWCVTPTRSSTRSCRRWACTRSHSPALPARSTYAVVTGASAATCSEDRTRSETPSEVVQATLPDDVRPTTCRPRPRSRTALPYAVLLDALDSTSTCGGGSASQPADRLPPERMDTRGCSRVSGHPPGPTGLRSVAEQITSLREPGGGTGLFTGCAAGDSGASVVLRVTD